MKKLSLILVLFVLAGVGAYAYYTHGKAGDKATVNQATLTRGTVVQSVQATGTLEPLRTVQVGSQVSGVVQALYADFNSIVKAGQIVAELDPSLLQVQVEVQKANIARQQGDIAQQQVQLESDRTNRDRAKALFASGLVSPQELETAELKVKTDEADIAAAQKQLVQVEAALHQAELNVSYCTIRSPVDGVVVDRKVDIGQTVQASMTTPQFFRIATDLTTLKLSASVDEADIGYIRRGMTVAFTVDAYGPQQQFIGSVDAVRLNAQTLNNVVTYPVWITVQNPDLKLRPSMTANLRIIVDQANNVLKVPNQALRFRPTSDMYTWLGMTPPAAGRGRNANAAAGAGGPDLQANANGAGGRQPGQRRQRQAAGDQASAGQPGQAAQPGQPGRAGQSAQGQAAQGGFGRGAGAGARQPGDVQNGGQGGGRFGRGGGGGGFGRGQGGGNLTPEQMAQFQQRFGGRGGRNRQGGQFGNAAVPAAQAAPLTERNADKIDDLFSAVPKRVQPGTVWVYDEKSTDPNKKLRQIGVRTGLSDTQFTELVSTSEPLAAGAMVVTGVVPPASALPKAGQQNIFQQQRGGFGGPGGGFGGPGGGGGGRRGGD